MPRKKTAAQKMYAEMAMPNEGAEGCPWKKVAQAHALNEKRMQGAVRKEKTSVAAGVPLLHISENLLLPL